MSQGVESSRVASRDRDREQEGEKRVRNKKGGEEEEGRGGANKWSREKRGEHGRR